MRSYDRFLRSLALVIGFALVAAAGNAAKGQNQSIVLYVILTGSYTGSATITVPNAQAVHYTNSQNCGNAAHLTGKKNTFDHWHFTYPLPQDGIDANGNTIANLVTTTSIDAFWNNYYKSNSTGNVDVTYNCWGYSLGYGPGCWIQSAGATVILQDDYNPPVDNPVAPSVDNWAGTHSRKILSLCINEPAYANYLCQTSEKNTQSAIYNFAYLCPGGGGYPENLPYFPFYQKKR